MLPLPNTICLLQLVIAAQRGNTGTCEFCQKSPVVRLPVWHPAGACARARTDAAMKRVCYQRCLNGVPPRARRSRKAKRRASAVARATSSAPAYTPTFAYTAPPFEPEDVPSLDVELPAYDAADSAPVDVVIAGAGPAGIATAARIGSQGLSVVVVDPNPLQHWPNNYGVWSDEFEAMGLQDCFEREWGKANVWLGDKDERCAPVLGRAQLCSGRLRCGAASTACSATLGVCLWNVRVMTTAGHCGHSHRAWLRASFGRGAHSAARTLATQQAHSMSQRSLFPPFCQPPALTPSRTCRKLNRRYARVDRLRLKQKLIEQCLAAGVRFHRGRAASYHHGWKRSTLECQDGVEVTAQVVVDATGHSRLLTEMDGKHDPGYQAAYGVMAGAPPRHQRSTPVAQPRWAAF